MAKMYYDKDADLKLLKGKTVAIIGYRISVWCQTLTYGLMTLVFGARH